MHYTLQVLEPDSNQWVQIPNHLKDNIADQLPILDPGFIICFSELLMTFKDEYHLPGYGYVHRGTILKFLFS